MTDVKTEALNRIAFAVVFIATVGVLNVAAAESWDGKLVQYGKMHDAIGKQQHQGRVQLSELVKRPHFYAVAALEGLAGEVTISNGKVTVTGVDAEGQMEPVADLDNRQYDHAWRVPTFHHGPAVAAEKNIRPKDFDQFIADTASSAGVTPPTRLCLPYKGEFE